MFNIKDVDGSLYLASKMFRDNCDEVIKLQVLNELLLQNITTLLKRKYDGIEEVNLYGNTIRLTTSWEGRLNTSDLMDIEELCGCTLDRFEDTYYWFDFKIDGNYNNSFNCGKKISDFGEEHRRITELLFGEL